MLGRGLALFADQNTNARRQRDMPERNVVQAMFPEGSEPIPNRRGTAPGIYLEVPRAGRPPCRVAAMPGVPSEMKVMFHDDVLPRIRPAEAAGIVIRHARVNCFGLGESAAEERLGDVTARGRDPEVGITVHEATITLRIVAHARAEIEALDKIASTRRIIYERMGEYAFGEEDEELEHVVVRDVTTGADRVLDAAGMFIFIGVLPHTDCFAGLLERDEAGFVLTGADLPQEHGRPRGWPLERLPYMFETSIPGVFAAGDVRSGANRRVAAAVGEGSATIHSVHRYLLTV